MEKRDGPPGVKRRRRVLSPDELVALWRASYKLDGPRGALVRLLMITLQRRSEVASLPWAELDQDKRLWLLPGERSKNGEEHLLPLSDLAMDEFKALGRKKRGLVLPRSEEHTSELPSLMRTSYPVFCLKKKKKTTH